MPITFDPNSIYLEGNPPVRRQFGVGRRSNVKPVIVVHTAQSGTDLEGPDTKAEAVAGFIERRLDAGSYHLIGDADSIIQLVRFENEAFHDGTGSNRWSIGISLAMNAADWPRLPTGRRSALIASAAEMSVIAGKWLSARGLAWPAPTLLTKAESDARTASGFISHARRDPGRRSDPGDGFPWHDFFGEYQRRAPAGVFTADDGSELIVAMGRMTWEELQMKLNEAGFDAGPVDGDPWTKTRAAFDAALAAAQRPALPDGHVPVKGSVLEVLQRNTVDLDQLRRIIGGAR